MKSNVLFRRHSVLLRETTDEIRWTAKTNFIAGFTDGQASLKKQFQTLFESHRLDKLLHTLTGNDFKF